MFSCALSARRSYRFHIDALVVDFRRCVSPVRQYGIVRSLSCPQKERRLLHPMMSRELTREGEDHKGEPSLTGP